MFLIHLALSLPFLLLDAAAPAGGFGQANLDAGTLREVLGDRDCTGLRVYNILLEGGQGSAMVIGIRADGTEINGGLFANPYKACAMNATDPLAIASLSRGQAEAACTRMAGTGEASISASIPKADVLALLDMPGCAGVRIEMKDAGGTFRLTALSVDRGTVTPLEGEGSYRSCGDPCPIACGSPSNYINEALLKR